MNNSSNTKNHNSKIESSESENQVKEVKDNQIKDNVNIIGSYPCTETHNICVSNVTITETHILNNLTPG